MAELVFVQAVVIYGSLGIALNLVWLRNLIARRPRWRWDSTEAEVLEFADQLHAERVVHVGPVPIVPGPPPDTLLSVLFDGLPGVVALPLRPPPLHRYTPPARHRHGLLIGARHRTAPTPTRMLRTCAPVADWRPTVCTTARHEAQAQRWLEQIREAA